MFWTATPRELFLAMDGIAMKNGREPPREARERWQEVLDLVAQHKDPTPSINKSARRRRRANRR